MESRDISYYNSSPKTYNTPVNRTSRASVNSNSQLPHFDPFKPAEYVLNNLGPVPGEEKIYAKLFKQNVQNTDGARSSVGNSKLAELHIRKPRVPYARISFDDSGIISDSDEFA
ncbi:10941_t:CDS:2 [Cetraspora pellucida]|uniref:10941_t:CDS:1 n=1 Tax=Cetraspora pellucida TaxID=1433469 RepID=A0ACA9MA94_9GLOM|nr:10941_t:CDS:2 [Cetraspora pellucida]